MSAPVIYHNSFNSFFYSIINVEFKRNKRHFSVKLYMLCYVMLCYVMLCYVMLCCVKITKFSEYNLIENRKIYMTKCF